MVQLNKALAVLLVTLAGTGLAHPGHSVKAEAAAKAAYYKSVPVEARSLTQCSSQWKKRGVTNSNIARREDAVNQLRQKRGLQKRDFDSVLAKNHHSNLTNVDPSTSPETLFGNGGTCIVQPEVTQGPFYITGELVRRNVAEDQAGVPLFLDIQLVDVNTCTPLPDIYTEIWHANATGVYSGVISSINGNPNDTSNIETTFLRGTQASGKDGVVRFETIFPGHYSGRSPHIHLVSHPKNNTKLLPNGTIASLHNIYDTRASHVGQFFFDESLRQEVEKNAPYTKNTQEVTTNSEDTIMATEAETTDPVVDYVFLGDNASDGIFAWISIGINAKADDYVSPEGYWTEDGAEVNSDFSMNLAGMTGITLDQSVASTAAPTTTSA